MKIFITGGTGLIGRALIPLLNERGHNVTVLTRNVAKAERKLGNIVKFYTSLDAQNSLDEYDAVINLAGESMASRRWTKRQKQRLCESRWSITHKLSELILNGENPPHVFISGSAIGYYGAQNDTLLTEDSAPNNGLTHQLCKKWEALALNAESEKTRVCLLRTGIVLSSKGGMLPKMTFPFKIRLGAVLGTGAQYISWIHIDDMVNAIIRLLENPDAKGAFNMTSPNPATNRDFSKTLAKVLKRPCLFRIPSVIVKLILGEMSTLVLDGQRAIPLKLEESGFNFGYPDLKKALQNVI